MREVAVLGGGPGGTAAAAALARGGADVTVFRARRAVEKPCGGAIPSWLLPRLPGCDLESLPSVRPTRGVLESDGGSCIDLRLEGLQIFRRSDLDSHLVGATVDAGARLVDRRVETLAFSRDGVELGTGNDRWSFRWLIGADGARGLCCRSLRLRPVGESVGLGATLPGIAEHPLVLSFPDLADAYSWIFPRPGGVSVGIAYSRGRASAGAALSRLRRFLDRHLEGGAAAFSGGSRYRYPIPVWGSATLSRIRKALAVRVLLVGDAAAVADPLTREGIRYAVMTGLWAAECLLLGREGDYPDRLRGGIARELGRALRARELFFESPLGQWMIPVCRFHPGVRRVLGDLLACRQPYEGLRRRLLRAAVGFTPTLPVASLKSQVVSLRPPPDQP